MVTVETSSSLVQRAICQDARTEWDVGARGTEQTAERHTLAGTSAPYLVGRGGPDLQQVAYGRFSRAAAFFQG